MSKKHKYNQHTNKLSKPLTNERGKTFFTRSVTTLRVVGGILSLLISIAMIAGLIYGIVMFFRADWLQSIISIFK